MKPMTKATFFEYADAANQVDVECYVHRESHNVYIVRGDERTKIAQGWDLDTSIRHENRYRDWLAVYLREYIG